MGVCWETCLPARPLQRWIWGKTQLRRTATGCLIGDGFNSLGSVRRMIDHANGELDIQHVAVDFVPVVPGMDERKVRLYIKV